MLWPAHPGSHMAFKMMKPEWLRVIELLRYAHTHERSWLYSYSVIYNILSNTPDDFRSLVIGSN